MDLSCDDYHMLLVVKRTQPLNVTDGIVFVKYIKLNLVGCISGGIGLTDKGEDLLGKHEKKYTPEIKAVIQ